MKLNDTQRNLLKLIAAHTMPPTSGPPKSCPTIGDLSRMMGWKTSAHGMHVFKALLKKELIRKRTVSHKRVFIAITPAGLEWLKSEQPRQKKIKLSPPSEARLSSRDSARWHQPLLNENEIRRIYNGQRYDDHRGKRIERSEPFFRQPAIEGQGERFNYQ